MSRGVFLIEIQMFYEEIIVFKVNNCKQYRCEMNSGGLIRNF